MTKHPHCVDCSKPKTRNNSPRCVHCAGVWKQRVQKPCAGCGVTMLLKRSERKRKYCSTVCHYATYSKRMRRDPVTHEDINDVVGKE